MKKFFLLFLIAWPVLQMACGSMGNVIQKSYAFSQISFHGFHQNDENGKVVEQGPGIVRFIYIETKRNLEPRIDSVVYRDKVYSATTFPVESGPVKVGKIKPGGENILLIPGRGNRLWKLELQLIRDDGPGAAPGKKIVLKGSAGKKQFTYELETETELESEERY